MTAEWDDWIDRQLTAAPPLHDWQVRRVARLLHGDVCPHAYTCPTSGEVECKCHGGFDVCCDNPACPGNR